MAKASMVMLLLMNSCLNYPISMAQYKLSLEAYKSLEHITDYSVEQFGTHQTNIYLNQLRKRIRWLAENPHLGKPRNEIMSGYHSYFEGSHTIFYTIEDDHIGIIDILHQSMDPARHLWDD